MKIGSMFFRDIKRPVNGVIKVMQTDEETRKQELEEYVITRELQKHFSAFYDRYEQSLEAPTDQMGVWISGFFGSGKSHFLKILSYLLANDEVAGRRVIDYFEDKFGFDPLRYAMMRRVSEYPAETILFNIDAKSPMGKDGQSILRVFTKVFYEHLGFYGDDLKIASFERFLFSQGKFEAFRDAFARIAGEKWEEDRAAFAFREDEIVAALLETTDISEGAARNWFNGTETGQISIDRLAREIREYVDGKGPGFHLIFLVDEIGQYIGDDSGLMLNLQTVVEELGAKCRGKVWVIVTSQEDIDSVTHVKGNDFSKIQGRFNTRLSLSSASVDEVIKRRILEKNEEARQLLGLVYRQQASVLRNLFVFSGAQGDLKGFSGEEEFADTYPFIPYQFRLLQNVLMQIRRHGSSGKHLSGGERSMLSAFKEAAEKLQERDESALVPFSAFYDTIHSFLDGAIRRVIDRAEQAAAQGNGLKAEDVEILKLLFLVRYVDEVPKNLENLTTLMVDSLHADKIQMRGGIQASLDRLVRENYVARSGETYLFLTDEEQDINREIRNTPADSTDIIHKIGQIVFADLYEGRRFRYRGRYDFPYDPMVDQAVVGQPMGEIKLRLVTLASDLADEGADSRLLMLSSAGNEAIVLLNRETGYFRETQELVQLSNYLKRLNTAQLPPSIRQIIQGKQQEIRDREHTVRNLLNESIAKGAFYILGERVPLHCGSAKEALDRAMGLLVEAVYSKLDAVNAPVRGESDVQTILTAASVQESMLAVDQPNAAALRDMLQFLDIREQQHVPVTVASVMKRYRGIPYGWQETDIAALLATLLRGQRIQLVLDGKAVPAGDKQALSCLRKRADTERTSVKLRVMASEAELRQARKDASELFQTMDLAQDEETLCQQMQALLLEFQRKTEAYDADYEKNPAYPGREAAAKAKGLLRRVLEKRTDNGAFLQTFHENIEEMTDWREDYGEIAFFFAHQRPLFDEALALWNRAQRENNYFAGDDAVAAALHETDAILHSPRPYRRIAELPDLMKTVREAYDRVCDERRARVAETIVQARGDLHTLGGDHVEVRDLIRAADAELERRRESALQAAGPTELDAMITQILTYTDGVCRRMEALLHQGGDAPELKIRTLRRYDVMPARRLASPAEVDAYLKNIGEKLKGELQSCDVIQLN